MLEISKIIPQLVVVFGLIVSGIYVRMDIMGHPPDFWILAFGFGFFVFGIAWIDIVNNIKGQP